MNTADYLIVGHGVAGAVLARTLANRGAQVVVAGAPDQPTASLVAAGIVNPLTGRKLVKTWKADELFPFLEAFYTRAEADCETRFFHPLDIYRPYRSADERTRYLADTAQPDVARYVRPAADDARYAPYIHNPFGGLTVTGAGWLDLPTYLAQSRRQLTDRHRYVPAVVRPTDLQPGPDSVGWQGTRFRKVIFCDGVGGQTNPFFSWLPFNPVKGQVLTVEVAHYPIENIVNQGVFVMPMAQTGAGEGRLLKIGATYSWHDLDWQTTDDGRQFLEKKVGEFLRVSYRIVGQQAGIRPSTKDRRPFLGVHPDQPAVAIFGGLGTKGVSLAPYLAAGFADFLLEDKEILPEVNISRYDSLYYRL